MLGGHGQIAEEIAQETFVRLFASPPVTQDNLAAWLLKVSTNLVYNYLKSDKQRVVREDKAAYTGMGSGSPALPEDACIRNQQILAVRDVLELLPGKDRLCLLLKFSGFTYLEIAEMTGVRQSSVGTVLARAQEKFKKEFTRRHGGDN